MLQTFRLRERFTSSSNKCKIHVLSENETCAKLAAANNIRVMQIISWNMNINPSCSNLNDYVKDTICLSNPLGNFAVTGTSVGPGASSASFTTPAPKPTNLGPNVNTKCGKYYAIQAGDDCSTITTKFGIPLEDFRFLNANISASCDNLWLHYSYCVAPVGNIATYSGYSGTATAPHTLPPFTPGPSTSIPWDIPAETVNPDAPVIPIANDTRVDCWQYLWINDTIWYPEASDCWDVSDAAGISREELALWNPSIDQNADDTAKPSYDYSCTLKPSVSYCIAVASATPDSIAAAKPPTPRAQGEIEGCLNWASIVEETPCDVLVSNLGLTLAQFYEMNPSVNEDCSGLNLGTYYCMATEDIMPGGGGSSGSATTTDGSSAPGPTQSGIIDTCNKYLKAGAGGSCTAFAERAGITLERLYAWNPALGSNGENCNTQFWTDEYYCVGVSAGGTTAKPATTAKSTTSTGAAPAPGPTQSGIISTCTKYLMAGAGGSCSAFSTRAGISPAQLYAWNPVLGANGENCNTQFWANEYYCVGVSGNSAPVQTTKTTATPTKNPTTSLPLPAPGPTQSGIANKCNAYGKANAGGSCSAFATRFNITPAQLYQWNPVLGAKGENCNTQFWADEYYCVGVAQ